MSARGTAAASPDEPAASLGPGEPLRAGFVGFLSQGPDLVRGLPDRTGAEGPAGALALTELLSQSLSPPAPALSGYAQRVAAVLDRPMRGASAGGGGGRRGRCFPSPSGATARRAAGRACRR